ncbi:Polysaccharide deacetylase, caspase activity [hydrothermal vent metagenome]|uniref:Polysaccharide deacetylase, caspase activity n=1 Tax=hydrothermal vent metagenome TaxID=652676 RepID=A0A1W1CMZ6_9ZZZZ
MQNLRIGLLFILIFTNVSCLQTEPNRGVKIIPNYAQQRNITSKSQNFGNYHALLIYIDDYTYLNKLETPKYDVEATAKILKERYGFKTTIVSNPKNSDELVEILDKLSQKITPNDNLLIYYAGHGHYIKKANAGYWQLKDARKDSRVGWISIASAINNTLNLMSAKHILVISDSCYSGAILRKSDARLGVNREDMRYYTQLHQKKSRNALTSGGLEPVLDGDPINPNHSIFTNGLLYSLQNNTKPIFVLEEKFSEIKRYIKLKADQTPQYSDIAKTGHEMGGDFIFVDRLAKGKLLKQTVPITKTKPINTTEPQIRGTGKKLIEKGDKAKEDGNIDQAMKLYRESCDLKNGIACAKLGMSYHKKHNDVKAVIFFTKACSLGVEKACRVIER